MAHKRANGEGSITFDAKKGLYRARYTDPNSSRRPSIYGKTRAEVSKKLTEALRSIHQGLPVTNGKQTVGAFLLDWLENVAKQRIKLSTFVSYEAIVKLHLVPAIGRYRLDQLSPQHCQALFTKKLTEVSPRRVQMIRATLRTALNQAIKWDLLARNVVTLTDAPKQTHYEIRPWTPEQSRRFLALSTSNRLQALYYLALGTGARQGELLALKWQDVDLTSGFIQLRGTLQRVGSEWLITTPKTEKSRRTLAISGPVLDAMKGHRKAQLSERLLAGELWQDTGHVFTTSVGTPLDASNVTHRFQQAVEKINEGLPEADRLPRQRFHDLRHATATFLLEAGMPMRVVMEQLGHSQISLTMNRYSHVRAQVQQEAADRLGAVLTAI